MPQPDPTPIACARRLLALFRTRSRINRQVTIGHLASHFYGRGFGHAEYRRATDVALERNWIEFPAETMAPVITSLGASALAAQDRPERSAMPDSDFSRTSR